MKKIPTLFIRTFEGHSVKNTTDQVTPGFEWVLQGEGVATVKIDGSCCAVIDGARYKRFDAKNGKKPPKGAIPCCDPDPVTGHWPHWMLCDAQNPSDRWFFEAYKDATSGGFLILEDATYEAICPHFQGNPYGLYFSYIASFISISHPIQQLSGHSPPAHSSGPTLVGMVSGAFEDNLKAGFVAAIVFPVILIVLSLVFRRHEEMEK